MSDLDNNSRMVRVPNSVFDDHFPEDVYRELVKSVVSALTAEMQGEILQVIDKESLIAAVKDQIVEKLAEKLVEKL